jgi:NitT/TauT family transport system substrate-binding protein
VKLVRAAACGAVALALAACSSGTSRPVSSASSPEKSGLEKAHLTVAAVPAEGAAGLYLAAERGLFARQGLHVTIVPTASAGTVIPQLLHGSIDIDAGQWVTAIAAQAAGAGTFHALADGFALGPRVQEIVTLPGSGITTPAQLRGKTIAVNALDGLTTDLTSAALAPYGITPAQVHYVAIPFPEMAAALSAHRVSAAFLTEPYLTGAEQSLGVTSIVDIDAGSSAGFPISGYMVTQQWYRRYPKTAAAFARALQQGNTLAATSSAALHQAMSQALHVTAKISDTMATGTFPTAISAAQLQRVADLMLRFGQLKKHFDVTALTG